MLLLKFWLLLQNHPQLHRKACSKICIVPAHIFNVYSIDCNTVCELRMVISQNLTFLSLNSLIQIYHFKKVSNVTVTSQMISTQNFVALFYFTFK